jgi:putative addiction module CopG family antidote
MDDAGMTSDLERFVTEMVAQGRYRDRDAVIQAGVALLQRAEAERAAFVKSLEDAHAEGVRDGFLTIDESMADIDALIAEMAAAQA